MQQQMAIWHLQSAVPPLQVHGTVVLASTSWIEAFFPFLAVQIYWIKD